MAGRLNLNPLSMRHPVLPPPVVLLAKVIAIAIVVKSLRGPTSSGVAFFAVLERIPPDLYGSIVLRLLEVGAALIIFNVATRTGAFVMSMGLFALNLGNMALFAHNVLLASLLLLLTALWTPRHGSRFLQLQMAMLYGGAALNKLLDPDWWSGAYLNAYLEPGSWISPAFVEPVYDTVGFAAFVLVASWSTMALEATAGLAFLRPETARFGVVASAVLHTGISLTVGFDYGIFLYVIFAGYLACVSWPTSITIEIPTNGSARQVLRALHRCDVDGILRLEGSTLTEATFRADGRQGLRGWMYLLLRFPPGLLLLQLAIVWPSGFGPLPWARSIIVAVLVGLALMSLGEERLVRLRARTTASS